MHATTTTSGVPTGAVTLFDGSTSLAMVQLAGGSASFTTSALSLGGHTLTAAYSGDPNFLPSASAVAAITVGVASDFTLTAMGATSQSIPAGSAATFNFAVAMQGAAIASPIALAVQGTPLGATASLSPTYLPPGGAVTAFTLTIQTPLARLDKPAPPFVPVAQPFSSSALLAIMLLPAIGFTRRFARIFHAGRGGSRMFFVAACIASFILLTALTTGCGNRVNTGPESVNAVSYTLTVTGTATSPTGTALQHTASVSLEVL
jgi:hypothetical protein